MNILCFCISDLKKILLVFLWCLNTFSFAQISAGQIIPAGLEHFAQEYSCGVNRQEHIFLSLNSGIYYPGESVMFKAMLLGNDMKIKTTGSRFFYLQLVDYTGKHINNYAFELHDGECSGYINIPASLHTGIYSIKAYTRWMLNFGADNVFERPVMIVSPMENTVLSAAYTDSIPMKFYPQCGRLISGVKNKILVRIPLHYQSIIKQLKISDETGNVIDTCLLDAYGTGILLLTPEAGHIYYASVIDSKNHFGAVSLPAVSQKGFVLQPNMDETGLKITIHAGSMQETVDNLKIVMLSENTGKVISQPADMNGRQGLVSVPSAMLSEGLHQILLCSGNNTILSQCTWYKKAQPVTHLKISVNDTLNTRSLAKFKISASSPALKKISAEVISAFNPVTDSLLFNECSYLKHFNLYAALPDAGILPVFEPEVTEEYINNCLIACLNTRLTGFMLHADNRLQYVQEIKGISLNGKVVSLPGKMPLSNAAVLLSYPDSAAHIDFTYTNKQGEFNFILNDKLYGRKVYIIVQDHSAGFNPVEIIINEPFFGNNPVKQAVQLAHPATDIAISTFQNIALAYRAFYQNKNIQPVVYRKSQSYAENFYGNPDFSLIPAEFESLPNIYEIRKNLIPGIKFDIEHDIFKTYIFDPYLQLYYSGPAFVLLNNIPFPSLKNMLELNSDNIRKIELKRNKFFYDNYLMFGIMAIYTKTPVSIESSYCHQTVTTPVIIEPSELPETLIEKSNLPDIRHTLLWKTNQLLSEGNVEIPFKTTDIKGSYRMRIIYVTTDGQMICSEKSFFVL